MVSCSLATGTLHDEFVQTDDFTATSLRADGTSRVGQSFRSPSTAGVFKGACLRMYSTGSPSGPIKAAIYAHSGTLGAGGTGTGAALVESVSYESSEIASGFGAAANYWFAFPNWRYEPDTDYVVVVDASGTTSDSSNRYSVVNEGGGAATHEGNSVNFSGTWGADATSDTVFKVYVGSAEVTALVAQAIETRIRDNVSAFGGTIDADRFAWQGMTFDPGDEAWIRPTVLFGAASYLTDGDSGTNLVTGLLQLSIFTVPGYGMSESDAYTSAARSLFDRVDIAIADHGNLEFGPAGPGRPGPSDGSWLHTIVECPFEIVENK